MESKQVYRFSEIRGEVLKHIDTIVDPVRETISPKGRNVLFEDNQGRVFSTNDGATILKNMLFKDPIQNAVLELIRGAALKTNSEVGDGTSTSSLLSQVMTKEGFKLVDSGWNPMDLKREFSNFGEKISLALKSQAISVKSDSDLYKIAYISSNSDEEIAKQVTRVLKTAGTDGMIFLEPNTNPETEIIEDTGFIIQSGLLAPEFKTDPQRFIASYNNVPVFITDKRLYYKAEAEAIMSTAIQAGHKSLVIIARDFLGESLGQFMANHLEGTISLLLIKDPKATDTDRETLHDLSSYLGGKVIMEKSGSLVENITEDDFVIAKRVFSDPAKTIIVTNSPKNKSLKNRIAAIRSELKKDKNDKDFKRRLASLTNGMVTVKVGGKTSIETAENVYRYEDSIQATRSAMKDDYLVGGGLALYKAYLQIEKQFNSELKPSFRKFCEANIRQIALNCGKHPETILSQVKGNIGYNAMSDKVEDLLKAGVIDPFKVTENAVNNSISITNQIISSNFLIVESKEDKEELKDK